MSETSLVRRFPARITTPTALRTDWRGLHGAVRATRLKLPATPQGPGKNQTLRHSHKREVPVWTVAEGKPDTLRNVIYKRKSPDIPTMITRIFAA